MKRRFAMPSVPTWSETVLRRIGEASGVSDLAFDEYGVCPLEVDGMLLVVEQRREGEALFLAARLGEAPGEGRSELFARLLNANVYFNGTGGATLAVSSAGGDVLLQRECDAASGDFAALLADFLNMAFYWKRQMEAPSPVERQGQSEAPYPMIRI